MTPIYLNMSSDDHYHEHQFLNPSDHNNEHQFLSPNSQASSSSNSLTCHLFFNHTTNDHDGGFDRESNPLQNEDDNFRSQTFNDHHVENQDVRDTSNGGLKFSLWKRDTYDHMNDENQVKWMSSKMRVMLKMKENDSVKLNTYRSTTPILILGDHQDHKEQTSSPTPMEEIINSNSINNISSNNTPIRVCSDCNTTKTPLWRSGPQGPKVFLEHSGICKLIIYFI